MYFRPISVHFAKKPVQNRTSRLRTPNIGEYAQKHYLCSCDYYHMKPALGFTLFLSQCGAAWEGRKM